MSETANIEITASSNRLPAALRQAMGMVQGFATKTSSIMGSALRPVGDIAKRAIGHAMGNLATRGIDVLVDTGSDILKFEESLTRFGIETRRQPSQLTAVRDGIRSLSTQIGVSALDILGAGRAYVDLAGAEAFSMEKMSLIARAAQASGSDVKDMAELMFTLTENMKVPDNQLEDTIGGLVNQAKDGSIHFRELAHELVALAPVYSQYGISGREGAIQLGGLMQIARRGFGSASEAGTGVLRILRSIPQHASKFRKFGIEVFEKGSKNDLDRFLNIIQKIKTSKLSLDREALIKAFGRTEGERFYQLLSQTTDQYDKLVAAGRENNVVQRDLAQYTESSSGKIAMAVEKMKNAVAVAFTPERVEAFANLLTGAANAVMRAAVWLDAHSPKSKSEQATTAKEEAIKMLRSNDYDLSLDQMKALAVSAQNYKSGDSLSGPLNNVVRRVDANLYGGDMPADVKQALVRGLGEDLGSEYHAVSAGMMVHQDEYAKAGKDYLSTLGWNPRAPGTGTGATQVDDFARAMRDALTPALDRITKALGGKITEVKVDGNPIARAANNATDGRRKP